MLKKLPARFPVKDPKRAARQRRYRERQELGIMILDEPVNAEVLDLLIRLGTLTEEDLTRCGEDGGELGKRLGVRLLEIARVR